MNDEIFDLIIVFRDGSSHMVTGVNSYGTIGTDRMFYFLKNGYRGFVPMDAVTFIGRKNDYYNI